ncbi:MAG: hypothetical protein KDB60_05025 [Propionibacteriaceae bacterium]|nr:hypothetical protein [Propionibacteriaceae bacterium]
MIVECRECLTGYIDPANLGSGGLLRLESASFETRTVGVAELVERGFAPLALPPGGWFLAEAARRL